MDRRTVLTTLGAVGMGMLGPLSASGGTNAEGGEGKNTLPPTFGKESRELLDRLIAKPGFDGKIPAAEAKKLAGLEGKSMDALMLGLIPVARKYSRPPISNFHVGAVARGASGNLYLGMNIEIPGQALGFAVHGEQAAMSNAYMHGEHSVPALAVGGAPCGHCRQFIYEMSPDGSIHIVTPQYPPRLLSVILPSAFSPTALGNKGGALPPPKRKMSLPDGVSDDLAAAALAAAEMAYAPYSKSPSGVAIETKDGRIFKGSYIENVAFNPSLPPFQTALVALTLAGESSSNMTQAVLVEAETPVITQKDVAQVCLRALAPAAQLRVVNAKIKA